MTNEQAFRLMGEIDERFVEAAEDYRPRKKRKTPPVRALSAAAACLLLAGGFGLWRHIARERAIAEIPTSIASAGVTVRYIDEAPAGGGSASLVWFDEDELFTHFDTAIFRGTVKSIRNIEIDFNGWDHYMAVAEIEVSSVVRGPMEAGEDVKVLLPSPVGTDLWTEDSGVISRMREGMEGIFMPVIYDEETSRFEANGAVLSQRDIAPYGLPDGMRWVFLARPGGRGVIYADFAYPSLAGVEDLDEVEAFVRRVAAP